jgi:hypothetical protein
VIALISSTLFPGDGLSRFSPEERLKQTRQTVESLLKFGLSTVYLVDNSPLAAPPIEGLEPVRLMRYPGLPFRNKGISELRTLLQVLELLPDGSPILKISGRYSLTEAFSLPVMDVDVVGRFYGKGRRRSMSTRCFMVRDREVLARLLEETLREVYRIPTRVVGFRSLVRLLRSTLFPDQDGYPYDDPPIGIEIAMAQAIQRKKLSHRALPFLGLRGEIAAPAGGVIEE